MILYPAIDMLSGRAVRLRQGKREDVTDYGDPADMADAWRAQGAQWLHLVDLDAAFDGSSGHLPLIRRIADIFRGPVEIGGGLRSMEDIDARMDAGVTRCILGTAAVEQPELVRAACRKYPGRIAAGIDAKDGLVAVRGWAQTSAVSAGELALRMREMGVTTVIYTDVSCDGMMCGPNVRATAELVRLTGMDVIASGGISGLDDLRAVKEAGCAGAILGRALYERAFTLAQALDFVKEEESNGHESGEV